MNALHKISPSVPVRTRLKQYILSLKGVVTNHNPYIDKNGEPLKGFRKKYMSFELEKRRKFLNKMSLDDRTHFLAGEKNMSERIQSQTSFTFKK